MEIHCIAHLASQNPSTLTFFIGVTQFAMMELGHTFFSPLCWWGKKFLKNCDFKLIKVSLEIDLGLEHRFSIPNSVFFLLFPSPGYSFNTFNLRDHNCVTKNSVYCDKSVGRSQIKLHIFYFNELLKYLAKSPFQKIIWKKRFLLPGMGGERDKLIVCS